MTTYCSSDQLKGQIETLQETIKEKREELIKLLKTQQHKAVSDYKFAGQYDGEAINLSQLFGQKTDLIVIHNMGQRCRYCTLWADGFNGIFKHLQDRAGFVLVSNDDVETQKQFRASRGWQFTMVSAKGTSFFADMGFTFPKESNQASQWGSFSPGISTFSKNEKGEIFRIASRSFGPGDDFCTAWHMFNLLADGAAGWEPQYQYN